MTLAKLLNQRYRKFEHGILPLGFEDSTTYQSLASGTILVTIRRMEYSRFRYVRSGNARSAGLYLLAPEKFDFSVTGPLIAVSIEWSDRDAAYCVTEHNPFSYHDERYTLIVNFTQAKIWGLYRAEQRGALLSRGIQTLDDGAASMGFFRPDNNARDASPLTAH
jgi:hypothetical protein